MAGRRGVRIRRREPGQAVAVRERERVFFLDGIRCSISWVVGAVIVEDRLLSLPGSPLATPRPTPSSSSHPTVVLYPSSKMPLTQTSPPPKDLPTLCLPLLFRYPQCRESSVAPLSSVCHRPRKRAVLFGVKCDRRSRLALVDDPRVLCRVDSRGSRCWFAIRWLRWYNDVNQRLSVIVKKKKNNCDLRCWVARLSSDCRTRVEW